MTLPADELLEIVGLTLQVTGSATALATVVGVPLGAFVALRARPSLHFVRLLLYTLYSLPPVIAGLLGYLLLSRSGPLGALGLLFTPSAIVVVETVLAAPLVAGLTVAAVVEIPHPVREAVRAAGATPAQAAWSLVREAKLGILAGVMVGFGRTLAEVAGALLVGGNIRHETRTLGTAIFQSTSMGDFSTALSLGGILLVLALVSVAILARLQAAERRIRG